jgi:hypothetical protein
MKALDYRVVASYRWIQNFGNHSMEETDDDFCLFQLWRVHSILQGVTPTICGFVKGCNHI